MSRVDSRAWIRKALVNISENMKKSRNIENSVKKKSDSTESQFYKDGSGYTAQNEQSRFTPRSRETS